MSALYLMVTVTQRRLLPDFISAYRAHGLEVGAVALGHGTAGAGLLGRLGIESTEKAVCLDFVTWETWRAVRRTLERQLRIDVPGVGVAFLVPMSSVGGRRELRFLTDGQEFEAGEESSLKGTERELVLVIANQGCSEAVMDAAREAGAGGGTVIHAKGTGMERAERFLGVTLASEKDVILIVVRSAQRRAVMEAVMRRAGLETRAQAIAFSLPVTAAAGLRLTEPEDDGPAEPPEPPAAPAEPPAAPQPESPAAQDAETH